MTSEERRAALDAIAAEVRTCDRCRLARGRNHAVPGEGSPDTEVVFVGEGPGSNEDRLGRPFVGAAGALLEELLGMIGWRREDVFITNVVKCRPPQNRDPEPDEMAACAPFLQRQLEILDPSLVVSLGRYSLGTFRPGDRISRMHGTTRPVDPATGARAALGFAMYHPAAALRQAALKITMQRDMAAIPGALIDARGARATSPPPVAAGGGPVASGALDAPGVPDADETPSPTASPQADLREQDAPVVSDDQMGLF